MSHSHIFTYDDSLNDFVIDEEITDDLIADRSWKRRK